MRSSSRTGSRRSRTGPAPAARAALVLLAALGPALAQARAQDLALAVMRDEAVVRLQASFRWEREEELAATLREGLESRITFTLRVFEKATGLRAVLGDRLLAERSVTRSAYYSFLDADYVVEDAAGGRLSFAGIDAALREFFSVREAALLILRPGQAGRCYAAAQVTFDPVRLAPPLTIISLAGAGGRVTTQWVRAEVPR